MQRTEQGHREAGQLLASCLLPCACRRDALRTTPLATCRQPACRSCRRVVRGFESGKRNDGDAEEYEREKSAGAEATKRAVVWELKLKRRVRIG
jgi:hypothetical protein